MKKIAVCFILLNLGSAALWAMPNQMTFQGTLKQNGVPVNVTENMQFSFVDNTGATIPGTSPISVSNVSVVNGLFAVSLPIDPTIPWEQYAPFIRVSVQGQILSPDQPVNANLYAISAIPQGMIAMFAASCPTGWTRFAALDNTFPMGGSTYGATGGSATHVHTFTTSGANRGAADSTLSTPTGAPPGDYLEDVANQTLERGSPHTHTGTTDPSSNIPPYLTVVWCQKT